LTDNTLVLLCKRPAPGVGKQRLAAVFGTAMAQRLAEALLACALEDARDWPGPVVIAPAQIADAAWAEDLLPQAQVLPQQVGNLGQRLHVLDVTLRAQGLHCLLYAGSDTPELTSSDYMAACAALQQHDVALTPAADGGVVLMGARQPWPDMADLPWGGEHLGQALASCCRNAGYTVAHLAPSFDVDEAADVLRLARTLAEEARPAREALYRLANRLVGEVRASHA
jgi:glycosyltransferase A (GT-A) superfamily protein (DUF2064 family)